MTAPDEHTDVAIIGAGPSGAIAAALLVQRGHRVVVLEREQFPRFSIGESLLPQCMTYIEEAGMLPAVQAGGFQFKDGAAFHHNGRTTDFVFAEKSTPGWETTLQVQRDRFDQILADEAARQGADVRYRHTLTDCRPDARSPQLTFTTPNGDTRTLQARFVLDASGFGRVLPRLLDLNTPSDFPVRHSLFTHVRDNIRDPAYDRHKILVSVHPTERDTWYWLIPFADGTASLGVVATEAFLNRFDGEPEQPLWACVREEPHLAGLLDRAEAVRPVQRIAGYSSNVKHLHGPGFALLGNAGEFLDPVFSSGVTIAMRSASMAADRVDRQLRGETVDWEADFARPLKQGVNTFRAFVEGWYDRRFQDIIFHHTHLDTVKRLICAVLAGYAWDTDNPYVRDSERRLNVLAKICRADA